MSAKTQLQLNNTELQKHLDEIGLLPNISDLRKGKYVWIKYKVIKDQTLTNPTFTGVIDSGIIGSDNLIRITAASFDRSAISDINFFDGFSTSDGVNKFEYVDGVLHYFWGSGSTQHWEVLGYDSGRYEIETFNSPYKGTFNFSYTGEKTITGKIGGFASYVADDDPNKYPNGDIGDDGFYYELYGQPVKMVSWADGTDEEIVEMVAAADRGEINLSDYWAVGQERKVKLKAMGAGAVGESHISQEVTFVLMNSGGKTLSVATESGRTECSFIVGMKNCLLEKGYMNSDGYNDSGWKDCERRKWCNATFKNSVPSTILPIFKQFKNMTGVGGSAFTETEETTDWFALPAEVEVFGSTRNSVAGEGTQFQWYKTASNRKKKEGDNGEINYWWERSPATGGPWSYCHVGIDGLASTATADSEYDSISPFGCI